MTITPEQHEIHLRQLAYFERKADELRKLTRQYQNDPLNFLPMQHNTWTRTKPTITKSCLLVVKTGDWIELYELIFDEPDVIPLKDGSEWGLWEDLTAQQYLTLKLPI